LFIIDSQLILKIRFIKINNFAAHI